jgi:hypothetical protein
VFSDLVWRYFEYYRLSEIKDFILPGTIRRLMAHPNQSKEVDGAVSAHRASGYRSRFPGKCAVEACIDGCKAVGAPLLPSVIRQLVALPEGVPLGTVVHTITSAPGRYVASSCCSISHCRKIRFKKVRWDHEIPGLTVLKELKAKVVVVSDEAHCYCVDFNRRLVYDGASRLSLSNLSRVTYNAVNTIYEVLPM